MTDANLSDEELKILRTWHNYNSRILNFENFCSGYTFEDLFGEGEGLRLFECFRFSCGGKYQKFTTYLTSVQLNKLYVHILRCPKYS